MYSVGGGGVVCGSTLFPVDQLLPHGVGVGVGILLVEIVLRLDQGLGDGQVSLGGRHTTLTAVHAGLHQVVVNLVRHHRVLLVVRMMHHKTPHPPGCRLRFTYTQNKFLLLVSS